jgi:hypothetical protein
MATVENRLPPPPRRGHRSSGGQQCFRDGKAERLGGLEVDDGAQRACVFKGLPTQTILTAIIKPKRLFPPRCKLWPFRRGLDECADVVFSRPSGATTAALGRPRVRLRSAPPLPGPPSVPPFLEIAPKQRGTVPPTAALTGPTAIRRSQPPASYTAPAPLPDVLTGFHQALCQFVVLYRAPRGRPCRGRVTREAGKNKSAARTGLSAAADEELLANFETLPQNL